LRNTQDVMLSAAKRPCISNRTNNAKISESWPPFIGAVGVRKSDLRSAQDDRRENFARQGSKVLTVLFGVAFALHAGASLGQGRAGSKVAPHATAETSATFSGGRAFEDLKHLVAFGPRPPGSKALADSRAWIESELKQAGCSVEEDSFTATTP